MAAVYWVVFASISNFTDTANLSRDTWSYHSIGVNFAMHNEFHTAGCLGKIEDYKFTEGYNKRYFNKFNTYSGAVDIQRNLGYPLFLSVVYKLFGVHPIIAKQLQLLMLVIVAAALPLLAFRYWGDQGFLSGLLAGPIFLFYNYQMANLIMSESLIVFVLFLILCAVSQFENKRKLSFSILLGVSFGLGLLVKGSLLLVPVFYFAMLVWQKMKGYGVLSSQNLAAMVLSAFIVVLPWSAFISTKHAALKSQMMEIKTIILDSQTTLVEKDKKLGRVSNYFGRGFIPKQNFTDEELNTMRDSLFPLVKRNGFILTDTIITDMDKMSILEQFLNTPSFALLRFLLPQKGFLDTHNELALNGDWRPEWRNDPNSFYFNDEMGDASPLLRIANFYIHNPGKILPIAYHKINRGFNEFRFLCVTLIFLLLGAVLSMIKGSVSSKAELAMMLACLPLLFAPFIAPISETIGFSAATLILVAIPVTIYLRKRVNMFKCPLLFKVVFLNYLAITILAMGMSRWIQVMDFIFILAATHFSLQYFNYMLKSTFPKLI